MSYIGGWGVSDRNVLFRMIVIFFSGLMCFAVLLAWRAQILFNAEPFAEAAYRPKLANSLHTPKLQNDLENNN